MDEVKTKTKQNKQKQKKTSLAHINEIQMTCKEHCHRAINILSVFVPCYLTKML